MRTATGVVGVIAAAVISLTGCTSSSTPHPSAPASTPAPTTVPAAAPGPTSELANDPKTSACWWAIHDQYAPDPTHVTDDPPLPPACVSVNPDDIPDLRNDVLAYLSHG